MMILEELLEPGQREEAKASIEAEIKKAIEEAKGQVHKKKDNYMSNKAEHDAKAFAVMDTNKDGTLQLSEFLACFDPENERNIDLHLALGFLTEEEVAQQRLIKECLANSDGMVGDEEEEAEATPDDAPKES